METADGNACCDERTGSRVRHRKTRSPWIFVRNCREVSMAGVEIVVLVVVAAVVAAAAAADWQTQTV